jgi:hypothetical protein
MQRVMRINHGSVDLDTDEITFDLLVETKRLLLHRKKSPSPMIPSNPNDTLMPRKSGGR